MKVDAAPAGASQAAAVRLSSPGDAGSLVDINEICGNSEVSPASSVMVSPRRKRLMTICCWVYVCRESSGGNSTTWPDGCDVESASPVEDSMRTLVLFPLLGLLACGDTNSDAPPAEDANISVQTTPVIPEITTFRGKSFTLKMPLSHGIAYVTQAATAAPNSIALIEAWELALQVAKSMTRVVEKRGFDVFGDYAQEVEAIDQAMPWGELTFFGEGTVPYVQLNGEYWAGLAKALPDSQAADFFKLADMSYGNASFYGWSAIQHRTWDYGGCSPLGGQQHLKILLQVNTIQQSPAFAAKVPATLKKVRTVVIKDLLRGTPEFPYCNKEDPAEVEKMIAEGQAILQQVQLSGSERKKLQQRVDRRFK